MELKNYSDRSRKLIELGHNYAASSGHQQLLPEHILKVLIEDNEGLSSKLIHAAGGNPSKIYQEVLIV